MARTRFLAKDCSLLNPQPNQQQADWLRALAGKVGQGRHVVSLAGSRKEDEPVVYCERDGSWWAGRYVGVITCGGRTLVIEPRFGAGTIRHWLHQVTGFRIMDSPGKAVAGVPFIAEWLAAIWAAGFVEAARHGLPALRKDLCHRGPVLRGRLDVRGSLRALATEGEGLVSVRTDRTLDHSASRAIVAGYATLRHLLGTTDNGWLPPRAKEFLPHLLAVTGPRPRTPSREELQRIRYSPITEGFRPFAELSRQIADRRGLDVDVRQDGETQGVLLDVAELWELYVLNAMRKAFPDLQVTHGTQERGSSGSLLCSATSQREMGTLVPDIILFRNGTSNGVVDAKYKPLHPGDGSWPGQDRPRREDLYQMSAYLRRFAPAEPGQAWGLLAYPEGDPVTGPAPAEAGNPWLHPDGSRVLFAVLPHDIGPASRKLACLLGPLIYALPH